MDPMEVLAPNIMADQFANKGVDALTANRGWGVTEAMQANPAAATENIQSANPTITDLRRSKAREMGRPMDQINF